MEASLLNSKKTMSQLNPTLGEKRVGWYFVRSGNDVVDGMKTQYAAMIDLLSAYRDLDPQACDEAQDILVRACELSQKLMANQKK